MEPQKSGIHIHTCINYMVTHVNFVISKQRKKKNRDCEYMPAFFLTILRVGI